MDAGTSICREKLSYYLNCFTGLDCIGKKTWLESVIPGLEMDMDRIRLEARH